jgi:cell wall-associated NlpC family hydrolase
MAHQETWAAGSSVMVRRASGELEQHDFETAQDAQARAAVIVEALDWTGTPFKHCSDIKGPNGCVDCAMLLVRTHVDSGVLDPFDPRPYPPAWHLHNREERFLEWIRDRLGGIEVAEPRVGDCLVYKFGLCFSHGAILINSEEVVHAFFKSGLVHVSRRDEQDLAWQRDDKLRPMKAFEVRR